MFCPTLSPRFRSRIASPRFLVGDVLLECPTILCARMAAPCLVMGGLAVHAFSSPCPLSFTHVDCIGDRRTVARSMRTDDLCLHSLDR